MKITIEAWHDRCKPSEKYAFNTPTEFIEHWRELDEGIWYSVCVDGKEICSGAVDPDDIDIFEAYFNMNFEEG